MEKTQAGNKKKENPATMRKIVAVVAAIVVLLVFATIFFLGIPTDSHRGVGETPNSALQPTPSAKAHAACVTSIEERTVRGSSMEGLLSDGDTVTVQFGYYGCNEPQRGEVALVHFSGDANPLIKVIKAVPEDSFSLSQASCGWNIMVNGNALQNSEAKDYCIGYSGYRMLSLYVQSYNGIIPQGAYLVLGNLVQGSTDSTRFGLTSRGSLLGKVGMPADPA
ncbi:MAG: signal peptidase I [Candidatus Micrarchaeia archaeon]